MFDRVQKQELAVVFVLEVLLILGLIGAAWFVEKYQTPEENHQIQIRHYLANDCALGLPIKQAEKLATECKALKGDK